MAKQSNIYIVLLLFLAIASILWYISSMPKREILKIGQTEISVELAVSAAEKTMGLSYRENLPENTGLLFIYDKADYRSFWMKEMRFPIDIIWIDAESKIISINKSVTPDTYPQTFHPASPAQYVLEVKAGFSDQHGLAPGQSVILPANLPL